MAPEEFLSAIEHYARQYRVDLQGIDTSAASEVYRYDSPAAARVKWLLNFGLQISVRDRIVDACFRELLGDRETEVSQDLYMSRDQLRSLAAHDSLGTHTHDHLPLGLLSAKDAAHQIRISRQLLLQWCGAEVYAMSYPYGMLDTCTAAVGAEASRQGLEFAFTMEIAGNPTLDAKLFLARCNNNDVPGGNAAMWDSDRVFDEIPFATWHRPAIRAERGSSNEGEAAYCADNQ